MGSSAADPNTAGGAMGLVLPGEAEVFSAVLVVMFALAVVVILVTSLISAPYGRHARGGWGPGLPARLGWVVMESPSVVLFGAVFALGPRATAPVPLVFLVLWLSHYVHRTVIYPLTMRASSARRMPILVVTFGLCFNFINSYLNGRSLTALGPEYGLSWLADPRFGIGVALFAAGFVINRWADAVLRGLRRSGDSGYSIPRGGLYELISCPNYFGEIVQWLGWALATWSLAGLSFAVFSVANLVPRAVAHHRWYRRTFPDYPSGRKAVVPLVL